MNRKMLSISISTSCRASSRNHSAIVSVREFARRATELAQELARGRGRDQTRGLWEQMMLVRDDVRFYAEESSLSESVRAKAQSVRDLIDRIAPLYAGD